MDQCCSSGKSENFSFPLNNFPGQNQVHLLYTQENMQIVVNHSLLDNFTTVQYLCLTSLDVDKVLNKIISIKWKYKLQNVMLMEDVCVCVCVCVCARARAPACMHLCATCKCHTHGNVMKKGFQLWKSTEHKLPCRYKSMTYKSATLHKYP